jgi:hypothetical protein
MFICHGAVGALQARNNSPWGTGNPSRVLGRGPASQNDRCRPTTPPQPAAKPDVPTAITTRGSCPQPHGRPMVESLGPTLLPCPVADSDRRTTLAPKRLNTVPATHSFATVRTTTTPTDGGAFVRRTADAQVWKTCGRCVAAGGTTFPCARGMGSTGRRGNRGGQRR